MKMSYFYIIKCYPAVAKLSFKIYFILRKMNGIGNHFSKVSYSKNRKLKLHALFNL